MNFKFECPDGKLAAPYTTLKLPLLQTLLVSLLLEILLQLMRVLLLPLQHGSTFYTGTAASSVIHTSATSFHSHLTTDTLVF